MEPQWAGMKGATAWHLIERQADDWHDIERMMEAWRTANVQEQLPTNVTPDAVAALSFVLANGLPMQREGKFSYHGTAEPVWHATALEAVRAAMQALTPAEQLAD